MSAPSSASPPIQFGELNIEQEGLKKNLYRESVESSLKYFKGIAEIQKKISSGGSVSAPDPIPENSIYYLTGLYIYCIKRAGACPLIPDSILEVEILRNSLLHDESCSSMKNFWDLWYGNQMEERAKHLVPIAGMGSLDIFNKQSLPVYKNCGEGIITKDQYSLTHIKKSYLSSPERATLADKMVQLIQGLKEQETNVFQATGSAAEIAPPKKDNINRK